jgi:hypothetical protein
VVELIDLFGMSQGVQGVWVVIRLLLPLAEL